MGGKTLKSKEAFFSIEFEVFTCEWVKKNLRSTFHLDLRCLPVSGSPLPAWDSWPSISIDWCISRGNDTAEPLSWYLHNLHWYLCNQSAMVAQSWYSFKHFSAIKHWLLSKTHQWYLLDSVQLILEQLLQSLSGVILPKMILQSMDSHCTVYSVHSWWFWHKCSTSKIFLHESSTDCSTNGLSDGFLSLIN